MVEQRLAACVQIQGPIRSVYSWDGNLCSESEHRLTIKTNAERLSRLTSWLIENHPYDEPQWVVVDVHASTEGYARWVHESLKEND